MSYGDVFCSKCQREVFQYGEWPNRKWMHLDDKTDMCAAGVRSSRFCRTNLRASEDSMTNELNFIHRHCHAIGTVLALFLLGAAGLASWGIWQCAR